MEKKTTLDFTRRDVLKAAAVGSVAAMLPRWAFAERAKRPYNVILINGDDFSFGEIGCYGSTTCETPNIDKLAAGGVRFETCWATPLCNPSRVQLLTGRYGFRTRYFHNWMAPMKPLIEDNKVYPHLLQKAGVKTAIAGKWHHVGAPWEYGFDESCITWGMSGSWVKNELHENPGYRTWKPMVVKNGVSHPTEPDDFSGDICTDFLIDFMKRNQDNPFYCYFPTILGHSPHYPTPDSILKPGGDRLTANTEAHFYENVEYVDKLVGRIVDAVDKLGIRDRTIIMFTTDNGTPPAKAHAVEDGCRVPLIVNCPGVLKVKGARKELVDFSDVFPTLVDLAGGKMPDDYVIDGHSFAPLLLGEPYKGREWVFSYCAYERMLRDDRWLYHAGGRFFDCGDSRDGTGYKEVTDSEEPEVVAARERFAGILEKLPPPDPDDPLFEMYRAEEEKYLKVDPNYSLVWYKGMRYPPKER